MRFTYTASDAALQSNTATVSISVFSVNDAPVAVGDSVGTTTTTPINVTAPGVLDNDSDPDNDPLAISSVNGSSANVGTQISTSHGLVTVNADGSFSYQAVSGYDGPDSFSYAVSDGAGGLSNTVTVNITVNASGGGGGGGGGGGCLIAC